MAATLPPELLNEILERATEGDRLAEQRRVKHVFRLVCREWYLSFNYWSTVEVIGLDDLFRLSRTISIVAAGASDPIEIKTLTIHLDDPEPFWSGNGRALKLVLAGLLEKVPLLERLSLTALDDALCVGYNQELDGVIVAALTRLTQLRHFKLSSALKGFPTVHCTLAQLNRLVGSWRSLVSLRLEGVRFLDETHPGDRKPSMTMAALRDKSTLQSVCYNDVQNVGGAASCFLSSLPRTVTAIELQQALLYSQWSVPAITAGLRDVASHTKSLILTDVGGNYGTFPARPRGAYDSLIPSFISLHRLCVTPGVISDLSTTLGPLVQLVELVVVAERAGGFDPLSHEEVVAFLRGPCQLERLAIASEICQEFAPGGRSAIAQAAKDRGVRLKWLAENAPTRRWN